MHSSAFTSHYIRWFEEIGIKDVSLVGGKNASLGELYRKLAPQGIKVPNGFAITAEAYWELLRSANLFERIKELLTGLDAQDTIELGRRGSAIRRLEDRALRDAISQLTLGYEDKAQFFVDKLAQGVAMIAAAFYPKDVIVRLSDFKTNEYANLIGGKPYEPVEENPMIGFRGASRYYDSRYQAGFALECRAMKKVRDEMGLTNVKLMIPFCRTVEEGRRVLNEMEKHGLKRGVNELEVYVMCEIPSNVILASDFAEIFDGFSIGSNDLTQLILGVDRDSEIVAHVFDERNPAVKIMIASVIRAAKSKGRKIGICGQAPSDYPDFAAFLVELGIDSISLNPDAVLKTALRILEMEAEIKLSQTIDAGMQELNKDARSAVA